MVRALPDLLTSSLFSRVTTELRQDLNRSALEAVTGQKSDITSATGGRNGQIHRAQMAIADSQATQTRLALSAGRYTQAAAAFQSIRNVTANFPSEAMQSVTSGSQAGIQTMVRTAESSLGVVVGALNTRFDGRSLFGGDNSAPNALASVESILAQTDTVLASASTTSGKRAALDAFFAPGGGFDTSIFQGGNEDAATAILPSGFELEPIARADGESYRNLIKGLVIVAAAVELPPVEIVDWVKQGADLIRSATEELTVDEASVGLALNRIDEAVEQEKDDLVVASETLDRIIGRDAFEAASETQNLEIRLEAAYSLTARLSRLSLTNYLR